MDIPAIAPPDSTSWSEPAWSIDKQGSALAPSTSWIENATNAKLAKRRTPVRCMSRIITPRGGSSLLRQLAARVERISPQEPRDHDNGHLGGRGVSHHGASLSALIVVNSGVIDQLVR